MKKLLGFIAVVAIAFTLTMTVNTNDNNSQELSDTIAYNIAEARTLESGGCRYTGNASDFCVRVGYSVTHCVNNSSATNCVWTPPGDDILALN